MFHFIEDTDIDTTDINSATTGILYCPTVLLVHLVCCTVQLFNSLYYCLDFLGIHYNVELATIDVVVVPV
jgi:hypothetical protein